MVKALQDIVAALGTDRHVAAARELTKRFEEIFRGTAAEALAHFTHTAPRGEFTLLISGA